MKLFKLPSFIIKSFISLFIFIIFVFIINGLGICQSEKFANSSDREDLKTELKEGNSVNVVPYTKGSTVSISPALITKGSKLEQVVKGLKDAGYSLDEVTLILKNDKNDASTVGIACLKQGFSGQQIYKSLLKSGYTKNSADLAVPLSIRQEVQILGISTNYNEAIDLSAVKNNTAKIEAIVKNDENSASNVSEALKVPVSVGITFNGLGNWNKFQNNRFGTN